MLLDDCYGAYINLDHRKDRKAHMQWELLRVGISAERFDAIDTKHGLPIGMGAHATAPQRVMTMLQRTPGAIGCHYSQVAVMRKAFGLRKHALVMEDDLVFCSDIVARLSYIEQFMHRHPWDIFWLGGTFHVNPSEWHTPNMRKHPEIRTGGHRVVFQDSELTDDPRILRTYGAFSTFAYIVNYSSIDKVLDLLEDNIEGSMGIDWLFIKLQPILNTFAFVPGCVKQMDNASDIGNGMTIFSGFSKLGPYWFQDKLEQFDPTTFNWAEAKHRT